jgi:hypothetical protein
MVHAIIITLYPHYPTKSPFFLQQLQQLQSNKLRASSQGAPQSKRNPLHRTKAGSIHAALSDADSPKALEPTKTSGWVWAEKIDQKT